MSSIETQLAQKERQHWMSVMAKAPATQLTALCEKFLASYQFSEIRAPEIGLTQVRGRMGGTGSQFNIGDVTITRCVVQYKQAFYGHSYVIGRNKQQALVAAKLDALLQDKSSHNHAYQTVIEPLVTVLAQREQQKKQAAAKTKVDFFTLVRGEV